MKFTYVLFILGTKKDIVIVIFATKLYNDWPKLLIVNHSDFPLPTTCTSAIGVPNYPQVFRITQNQTIFTVSLQNCIDDT